MTNLEQDQTPNADAAAPQTPTIEPEQVIPEIEFTGLGLEEPLEKAIAELGWTKPTPIQCLSLPLTTKGRDVAGFAQTGTGKTGVFLITIAERLLKAKVNGDTPKPFAVILAPTRELAMQIEADAVPLLGPLGISSMAVFGGIDYDKQIRSLKSGIDVVVATPGRLKDYCQKKAIDMGQCQVFVCDEADRMLDMGFIEDVEFFLARVPEDAQKLLFSATTNDTVKELAFEYLEKPEYISANPEDITPKNIEQRAVMCRADQKLRVMLGLYQQEAPERSIIFTNTKLVAEWLHYKFNGNGIQADMITGDLPQRKRIGLIKKIKDNEIKALIATDVASRGLHIAGVTHVFNFDLPDDPANYVHRIGRTARAGAKGISYSLVCDDYGQNLDPIGDLLGVDLTPDCNWFDEKFLNIEDKAGDWAADRAAKERATEEKFRKERAEQFDKEREARRERNDRKGASTRDAKGRDDKKRQPQGRDRNRQGKGQQGKGRQASGKALATQQQPKGAFQWLKKIFKAFFGGK